MGLFAKHRCPECAEYLTGSEVYLMAGPRRLFDKSNARCDSCKKWLRRRYAKAFAVGIPIVIATTAIFNAGLNALPVGISPEACGVIAIIVGFGVGYIAIGHLQSFERFEEAE